MLSLPSPPTINWANLDVDQLSNNIVSSSEPKTRVTYLRTNGPTLHVFKKVYQPAKYHTDYAHGNNGSADTEQSATN